MVGSTGFSQALAAGLLGLVALTAPDAAGQSIEETQIFGTFGAWTAYRDLYERPLDWVCVAETDAQAAGVSARLHAFATYVAFSRQPELTGPEEVLFEASGATFRFYVDPQSQTAYSQDAEDFLALLALASAPGPSVSVVVRDRAGTDRYQFRVAGFHDAYRIIGQACDFETGTLLEAAR